MLNLAGNREADCHVEQELIRARINIVVHDEHVQGEVPTRLTGVLTLEGQEVFTFGRAWYYWVVYGRVPLWLAQELYTDPVGKTDIRVAGHGSAPPPEEWALYLDSDGNELISQENESEYRRFEELPEVQTRLKSIRFVANPAQEAALAVVESYHIDTEVGLRVFVDALRTNGLVDS